MAKSHLVLVAPATVIGTVEPHRRPPKRVFAIAASIRPDTAVHSRPGSLAARKHGVAKLQLSPLFVLRVTPIGPLYAKLASVGNPASKRGNC